MSKPRVIIVGGGAAGFFAAIACAEANPEAEVLMYELTANLLAKVRVSGGGRCNVTHACFEPRDLVKRYPRGGRELLGAFSRWQPRDTIAWFAARGVELKTEDDGRMFPITDDSATIVECLTRSAGSARVQVRTSCGVKEVERMGEGTGFAVTLTNGETVTCDRLLIATGGGKMAGGLALALKLGHTIEPPVPSLFTFHIDDARLKDLAGLSVENAGVSVTSLKLREQGPLLITHWGMSGPAILRLSAWGARALQGVDYKFTLTVNWLGGRPLETVRNELAAARTANPRKQVVNWNPFALPQRFWERLVAAAGVAPTAVWTSVSNQLLAAIAGQIAAGEYVVAGKSMNKEEFVTCGGVRLGEVDFKTMQSRVCPGLFFAGEVLDIDGITGGFNFQAAWTTGWLAGKAMAGGSA
ncbi:MAG: NAD(P)/FAD-dependent oxidoreductase [Verrucomicrobia bacterium]|nr:NAD(P)/FAD-dependent oxidoreductase [Verrucomicrobiota bacterium]